MLQKESVKKAALGTIGILLIPLVAMQVTDEVDWGLADFAAAGVLLFSAGLMLAIAGNSIQGRNRLMLARIVLVGALFAVWAELAVGVFGTPFAGS